MYSVKTRNQRNDDKSREQSFVDGLQKLFNTAQFAVVARLTKQKRCATSNARETCIQRQGRGSCDKDVSTIEAVCNLLQTVVDHDHIATENINQT